VTNSRSLPENWAVQLAMKIGAILHEALQRCGKKIRAISRSDSTLRGHFQAEVNALAQGLEMENAAQILIPAFFQGGRYTMDDIHYVEEKGHLIPVGETLFAADSSFGFKSSNLKDWVQEKTGGTD